MIELPEECAKTVWFALKEYRERLRADLDSKYNGDARFGAEDVEFLTSEIKAAGEAIDILTGQGITY